MEKYSLVGYRVLIMYAIVDGIYVIICSYGRLVLYVVFLTIIYVQEHQEENL